MATTRNTPPRNAGKPFSERAVNFILRNAGKMSASAMAGRLGRTVKSVRSKAERLGVPLSLE